MFFLFCGILLVLTNYFLHVLKNTQWINLDNYRKIFYSIYNNLSNNYRVFIWLQSVFQAGEKYHQVMKKKKIQITISTFGNQMMVLWHDL